MKETGEILKNRRLEKKFSLEEISSQTKIQLSILKNLEEGRLENLKNKTYTKGFLRQYARALGLNPDEIVARFDQETSGSAPSIPDAVNKPKTEVPIQDNTNVLWFRAPSKMITVMGVLIIGTLATAIYFFSVKMASYSEETFKEPVEATEPAAEVKPVEPPVPEKAVALEPIPDTGAPTPAPSPTPTPAAKPAEVKAVETPAPTKATEKPAETSATSAAATATPTPPPAKPKSVAILANEDITIEASWSSGKKESLELKSKSKHTFYYSKKITLLISNGGAVDVTANEEKLGVPGEAGQPLTMSFD